MTKVTNFYELFDVAIVGYGPTGATLANLLALRGLKVAVLERESDQYHLPRAVHFDDEIMRIFGMVGIAKDLSKKVRVNPGMQFVDTDGALIMDWPRPQEITSNGWHASYRFHQPDLEKLLRNSLRKCETATVIACAEVVQIQDQGEKVEVHFEGRGPGPTGSLTAKYVVGCDGARSFVRQNIADKMEDLGFNESWLVVDAILKRPMPELGDHSIQHCDSVRPVTYCRSPDNRRRWEIKITPDDDISEIATLSSVWKLLNRWITSEDADLERTAVYTFHSAIAHKWKSGRLLIAGDAAHLTPPFMGQGMCAGIRDAANLAWKLAHCVKGSAPESLLETYQSERSPHVREYIKTAIRLGGLINSLDPRGALDLIRSNGDGQSKMNSISPRLGDGLKSGCSAASGLMFPNPVLVTSERLDDTVGNNWALVAKQRYANTPGTFGSENLTFLGAQSDPALMQCLEDLGTNAVLVRPDKYILGTANTEDEVTDLIRSDPFSEKFTPEIESEPSL